jgi:hypothetical protein
MTEEEEAVLAGPTDVSEVKVETEEEKAARDAEKAASGEVPAATAPAAGEKKEAKGK